MISRYNVASHWPTHPSRQHQAPYELINPFVFPLWLLLGCSSSSLTGDKVDVKGIEVIKERREYERRRSAFDISEDKHGIKSRIMKKKETTNPRFSHSPKNSPKSLNTFPYSLCMCLETMEGIFCFLDIEIGSRMIHSSIECWTCRWHRQMLRKESSPFLTNG